MNERGWGCSVGWKHAGLITIWFPDWIPGNVACHIVPARAYQQWGRHEEPASIGDFRSFGLGPFVLITYGSG